MSIIEKLQLNKSPFGLMGDTDEERREMQEKARGIVQQKVDACDFDYFNGDKWYAEANLNPFIGYHTYRLRPDYQEEEGVIKCEVFTNKAGYLMLLNPAQKVDDSLSEAMDRPDFVGFLYEDGIISSLPRMYKIPGLGKRNFFTEEHCLGEVLTPTHVLFRR